MTHRTENSVDLSDHAGNSPSERALTEAAEWYVQLGEGPVPEADRHAFERWLQADSDHVLAWRELEAIWDTFDGARRPAARDALELNYREERREVRRLLGWGTGVLLLLLAVLPVAWLAMGIPSPTHLLADHHTAVGERKTIDLPDGSRLVLNTATAVDVRFAERRRIYLHDGEIHITVAPDIGRPLDVITDESRTQALGTRFSVRRVPGDDAIVTRVSVYESRVEICPIAAGDDCRRLEGGQQAQASAGQVSPPVHISPDPPAWLQGRLEVEDRPVTEVLAELARYHRGLLRYDASALAGIKVSGVLPLDDTERALNALATTVPINIERYTPWMITVTRAP